MAKQRTHDLPQPLTLKQTLGPSFILLGLALGSGELIMWPYLSANYGLGLLWGGLLGISFQYLLNTEIMRYSLAWGESVFVGFRRLSRFWPFWFIFSTFIPWSLPGFSSATAKILTTLFPLASEVTLSIFFLLFTGIILTVGKTLYKTMELLQRTIILVGLPFILYLATRLTLPKDWFDLTLGLIGRGDGWWFFPSGIALGSFLGAFAYSGAGGNLNLTQSYYVKEKGLGMGKYSSRITSLFSKGKKNIKLTGETFPNTPANQKKWRAWWQLVTTEHFLVFWSLGFLTIVLLSVLAKSLVYGSASASGLTFLFQEANQITSKLGQTIGAFFLLVSALMLFSTQIGVLESSSRIISENFLLFQFNDQKTVDLSKAFYLALWGQIILGILVLLLGFQEPRFLLTLGAILNAVAMMVAFPLIYSLNQKRLQPHFQSGIVRKLFMFVAFLFFLFFVVLTFQEKLAI